MTIEKFIKILKNIGYPVAYHHFKSMQNLPYIIYTVEDEPDFIADNKHYKDVIVGFVELYTNIKDFKAEEKIKNTLKNEGIFYAFESNEWIESEDMYLTRFRYEFIGGN